MEGGKEEWKVIVSTDASAACLSSSRGLFIAAIHVLYIRRNFLYWFVLLLVIRMNVCCAHHVTPCDATAWVKPSISVDPARSARVVDPHIPRTGCAVNQKQKCMREPRDFKSPAIPWALSAIDNLIDTSTLF